MNKNMSEDLVAATREEIECGWKNRPEMQVPWTHHQYIQITSDTTILHPIRIGRSQCAS